MARKGCTILLPVVLSLFVLSPTVVVVHSFQVSTFARHAFSTWHISSVIVDDLISSAVPIPSCVALPPQNFEKQTRQWANKLRIDLPMAAIFACLLWSLEQSMADHIAHTTTILWDHYSSVLVVDPIVSKAAAFATIYTLGDIIAQAKRSGTVSNLDRDRIARSMLVGLMVHCPMSYLWCNICDTIYVDTLHFTSGWVFLPRVLIDQNVWGPLWNKSYLLLSGLMKGDRFDVIWDNVEKSPIPVVLSSHKSAAHLVTYLLVPAEYQRFWIDFVEVIWVAVLSTRATDRRRTDGLTQLPPVAVN